MPRRHSIAGRARSGVCRRASDRTDGGGDWRLICRGLEPQLRSHWLGWGACLAITVVTGSRMASLAMLLQPILNPVVRGPLRRLAAVMVVGAIGVGIYLTPMFQERFFHGDSGDIGQLASGDFDSPAEFEAWPIVLEEAPNAPYWGMGSAAYRNSFPAFGRKSCIRTTTTSACCTTWASA